MYNPRCVRHRHLSDTSGELRGAQANTSSCTCVSPRWESVSRANVVYPGTSVSERSSPKKVLGIELVWVGANLCSTVKSSLHTVRRATIFPVGQRSRSVILWRLLSMSARPQLFKAHETGEFPVVCGTRRGQRRNRHCADQLRDPLCQVVCYYSELTRRLSENRRFTKSDPGPPTFTIPLPWQPCDSTRIGVHTRRLPSTIFTRALSKREVIVQVQRKSIFMNLNA